MRENRSSFGMAPPVKVGEELDVTIEAVGEKGDGIAKKNGFVLFVPNTSEGDKVRIRVTKVLHKVGFAEVVGKSEGGEAKEAAPAETEQAEEVSSELDSEDFGDESTPDEEQQ